MHRAPYKLADDYRARGADVCLGGLHVTSLPEEAAQHADTIFIGPGEDTWPAFLEDFRARDAEGSVYLTATELAWRAANTTRTDQAPSLPGAQFYRGIALAVRIVVTFVIKNLFSWAASLFIHRRSIRLWQRSTVCQDATCFFWMIISSGTRGFAGELFDGMRGMGRLWQAAATVGAVLEPGLLERAVESGLRSLFVGFETLDTGNLLSQRKYQNLGRDYNRAVQRLHDLGVMVNASFVFGMDHDDETVFERTVSWAVGQGIETATFHILTPYPGTALHRRLALQGRITSLDWERYDTRHVVFQPARMSPEVLEAGYWGAYRDFYSWYSIYQAAATKRTTVGQLRHLAYTGGWKKFEPFWDLVIRLKRVTSFLPLLEGVLNATGFNPGRGSSQIQDRRSCNGF